MSAESSRTDEILRAEESIRLLAAEYAHVRATTESLKEATQEMREASYNVEEARLQVVHTQEGLNQQYKNIASRLDSAIWKIDEKFGELSKRLDTSTDGLSTARKQVVDELHRLETLRNDVMQVLADHHSQLTSLSETLVRQVDISNAEIANLLREVSKLDERLREHMTVEKERFAAINRKFETTEIVTSKILDQLTELHQQIRDALVRQDGQLEAVRDQIGTATNQSRLSIGLGAITIVLIIAGIMLTNIL